MDNLEAIIKAAAETVLNGTGTYTYARKAEFNLDHDKPAPHIVFFDPTSREGEIIRSYNCLFMFAEPDPDTNTRESREPLIARMGRLWYNFLKEIEKHDLVQFSDRNSEKLIKEFQARLSGMAYQCTITTPLPLNCDPIEE